MEVFISISEYVKQYNYLKEWVNFNEKNLISFVLSGRFCASYLT